jgi:hypothetical protein
VSARSVRLPRLALVAALLLAPLLALAEAWDAGEVAEAEQLRVAEAARAAEYRRRVARGDVRAAAAPMPRAAPDSPGDALRDAADIVDFIERLLRGGGDRAEPRRSPERDELRRRERERRRRDAEPWWEEEEERLRGGR